MQYNDSLNHFKAFYSVTNSTMTINIATIKCMCNLCTVLKGLNANLYPYRLTEVFNPGQNVVSEVAVRRYFALR